jgi:hypothetical protein
MVDKLLAEQKDLKEKTTKAAGRRRAGRADGEQAEELASRTGEVKDWLAKPETKEALADAQKAMERAKAMEQAKAAEATLKQTEAIKALEQAKKSLE